MADNDGMPIVGNSVHFYAGGECRAAIVTRVDDEDETRLDLVVFMPTGQWFNTGVARDETWDEAEGFSPGSWHWSGRG